MYPPETKCPVGYVINPSYSSSFLRLAVTAIAAAKEENIKNATAAFPILPVLGIETPLISVSAVFPEFDVFPSVPGTDEMCIRDRLRLVHTQRKCKNRT